MTLKDQYDQCKIDLQNEKELVRKLTRKCETIKENYKRVLLEKDNILNELNGLRSSYKEMYPCQTKSFYQSSYPRLPKDEMPLYSNVHSGIVSPPNFYGGFVERDGPCDEKQKNAIGKK